MLKKENKQAVCIGAGFGGIAAALRLKRLGFKVVMIDKLLCLGGRAQVYEKNGFSFDAGPTVLTAPHLLEDLFGLFQKKLEHYVELIPLELWYRYLFEDGRTLDYGRDLEATLTGIYQFNPKDVEGYKKLLKFSEKIFQVGFEKLASKPFHHLITMLQAVPDLLRLKSYKSVYQLVSTYIENDSLRRAFTISPLLVGGNPFQTTSIYTLIHFLERKWGIYFAKGGTGALVRALGKLMQEENIQLELKTTVKKIVVTDRKVQGVLTESGHYYPADVVVVNGDPAFVYKNLIDSHLRKKWTDKKIDNLTYSMGLFVLYFGTKKIYSEVAHHNIVFGKTYRILLNEIFKHNSLSDDISLYVHRPTATDPEMAPIGCDSFYALAPVPNLKAEINWKEVGPLYQEKLIQLLEKRLLPDLRNQLVTAFYVTPETFKSDYLSEQGAGFSIAPLFRQSAYFRFHNKSEDIKSLYFVGAGTHPGAGLPGVLSSAKLIEEIIKKEES